MKRMLLLLLCLCLPLTALADTLPAGAYIATDSAAAYPCLIFHADGSMEAYSLWQKDASGEMGHLLAQGAAKQTGGLLTSPLAKAALSFADFKAGAGVQTALGDSVSSGVAGFTLGFDSGAVSYVPCAVPALLPTLDDLCLSGGWYDTENKTTYRFQLDGTLSRTKNYHEKISAFRYDAGRLNAGGSRFLLQYACKSLSALSTEQMAALDKRQLGAADSTVYLDLSTLLCWQIYRSGHTKLITLRRAG